VNEISVSETQAPQPPVVSKAPPQEVAENVFVILDGRVPLVPNVGIVMGEREALVIDTGMGPGNGRRVREAAESLTDRPLALTVTHFHPEHGFGAQVFRGGRIIYNRTQKEEFDQKGAPYLEMFRGFGPTVAEQLEGVEFLAPGELYDEQATVDLGGVMADLHHFGPAHTLGDQVVFLPKQRVLFTGDLVETRFFPIFPWFPPDDADVDGSRWINVLTRLESLEPEVVVPGHGEVGGPDLIWEVREYLEDVRARVAQAAPGRTAEEVKAELEPAIRSSYPSWDAPEWIGFAVDCFYAKLDA
jgi:glyoxylase-like metal-dependent hydrolase (beta-lactamase superfamily II)